MDPSVYSYLRTKPMLLFYLRHEPSWYRTLTRDPSKLDLFEKQAKRFHGRTIPQRVEKVSDQMQMMAMLFQMASAMKD
ncbi:hypothetical protein GCM10011351_02860 [Paraliobacillus quinghaiensis]|uniref:YlbE-like protein n=1 Tax=Paraliobacillus quinghaiensis TaxID=470815 RepID=A0A917TFK3_9BACI|nr:YlbE-like family protein [Paraliobacillus quinghaiensis]GGM20437.1 hypothetical protein GCM10011351_02860 [Paraliobacillus quinghaiensis]